jgi:meso-butanediol dehydrogenase/(S,S)-butanediol dehydrogenase/diacetyl reductase
VNVTGSQETTELVRARGGAMVSIEPVDLSDPRQVQKFVEFAAAEWDGLDIVYNNASAQRFMPFAEFTVEDWEFTMKNDLELVFLVNRFAWKHLVERGGGSIINIASVAGLSVTRSHPGSAHATAKAGVLGMTRALAIEGAPHNIRANSICPGLIDTPVSAAVLASDVGKQMAEQIPIGRIGQPEDIVHCAVYLASDESSFVTGANIVIDGGTTIVRP